MFSGGAAFERFLRVFLDRVSPGSPRNVGTRNRSGKRDERFSTREWKSARRRETETNEKKKMEKNRRVIFVGGN